MSDPASLDEIRSIIARLSRSEIRKLRKELELTESKPTLLSLTMVGIVYSERASARTPENVIRYVEQEARKHELLAPGERANPASIRTMMRHAAEYRAALERAGKNLRAVAQKDENLQYVVTDGSINRTISEAVSAEKWKKTQGPAKIMLQNLDKGPDEIYAICVRNEIDTTRDVVKGLCYRYNLYKKARDTLGAIDTVPADVESAVLQNLTKSPRQIESICTHLGIKAALNTVRTLHSYFRLFVELRV